MCKRGEAMTKKDELIKIFAVKIREILSRTEVDFGQVQEIRLRANRPLLINVGGTEYFVSEPGRLEGAESSGHIVTRREVMETLEYVSNYSMYAYEDELRQGFLTIQGGHRIGVAGRIVMEQNRIKNIKHIAFLNVRLSHEVKGCADRIMPRLFDNRQLCHTLLISPPRCGKTTLLRDIIRQVSDGSSYGSPMTVGVVDERSEIGGAYLGIPQNDLGVRTDLLDCCPKAAGMMMLIRSMSPQVIAVDEIGDGADIEAIESVVNCGCKLIATVHGNDAADIRRKPILRKLLEGRVFQRFISLNNDEGVGTISEITDENGQVLYQRRRRA